MSAQPSLYTGPSNDNAAPMYGAPVAPSTVVNKTTSCSMTAEILEQHLQQSNYGENKAMYHCYFMEGMPPRCVTCGESIGAHPRTVTAVTVQPFPGSGTMQPVAGGPAFTDAVLQPECSFCKNLSVVNEVEFRMGIDADDKAPLVMKPVPFNDDMAMRSAGHYTVECDECYTEFPVRRFPPFTSKTKHHPIPPASEEEQEKIRSFFTQYPQLQCYACKYCKRKVCSDCIKNNLHEGPNSRFNSRENEWKTSLLGCCGSPKHTVNALFCYYFCLHSSSAFEFKPVFAPRDALSTANMLGEELCLHFVMFPIFSVLSPAIALTCDILLCSSVRSLCAFEASLQRRYGLPSQGTAALLFCRYCAFIRMIREVEERGYPQHTCCTRPGDVEAMVSQYPAAHPLAVNKGAAPPGTASMF